MIVEVLVVDGRLLRVKRKWSRFAMDVTIKDGGHFLTLIDSSPSRFAIRQGSISVIRQLESIFFLLTRDTCQDIDLQ